MRGISRDDVATLEALARGVGEKLGWELHFQADDDPAFAGLTAGSKHTFITGPDPVVSIDRESVMETLQSLKNGAHRILVGDNGDPILVPPRSRTSSTNG